MSEIQRLQENQSPEEIKVKEFIDSLKLEIESLKEHKKSVPKESDEHININDAILDNKTQLNIVNNLLGYHEKAQTIGKHNLFLLELREIGDKFHVNGYLDTDDLIRIQSNSKERLGELKNDVVPSANSVSTIPSPSLKSIAPKAPKKRKDASLSKIPKSIDLSGDATDIMVSFIKFSEGFRKNAYLDSAGVPTIGWGTITRNGKSVKLGDTITKKDAEKELRADIKIRFNKLDRQYSWFKGLNKNQQAAFVSFSYNLGSGIFNKGESLKSVMDDIDNVTPRRLAQVFIKYNKARNPKTKRLEEVRGLTNRRNREIEVMLRPENLKDNEIFSVIYKGDTLGDTISRMIYLYDNSRDIDSGLLSMYLEEEFPDFKAGIINPYQTVLIEDNGNDSFSVHVAEKGKIIFNESNFIQWKEERIPKEKIPEEFLYAEKTIQGNKGDSLGILIGDLIKDLGEVSFSEIESDYERELSDNLLISLNKNGVISIGDKAIIQVKSV